MFEIIVIFIGTILILLGLAGSILPILPGPPLSFIGLLLLALINHFSPPLTPTLIILMGLVTVVSVGLDMSFRYGVPKDLEHRNGESGGLLEAW